MRAQHLDHVEQQPGGVGGVLRHVLHRRLAGPGHERISTRPGEGLYDYRGLAVEAPMAKHDPVDWIAGGLAEQL